MNIEQLKHLVNLRHPYKPSIKAQRMLYAGKSLTDPMTIKEILGIKSNTPSDDHIWGQTKTFHLMIKTHTIKEKLNEE